MDTYCTSQWLSNSFFPTLADILDIWSKELMLHSKPPGNLCRILLQPSLWSPQTLVTRVQFVSSNWSSSSLCCPWRCATLMNYLPNFSVSLRHATGQPCSGLCCQQGSPLPLTQAHSLRTSPTHRSLQIPIHSLWSLFKIYFKQF